MLFKSKKNVALVLSGGGARGLAHIGVIEELERQGYNITSITGSSMGALIGGVYAVGKLAEFKQWLYTLGKLDIIKLVDFSFGPQGFIKGDKIIQKIQEFVFDIEIEDLKINYAAIATDIINNKEVIFTTGNLYEAIRASISIPTVFTPIKKGEMLLVDGGVINNIPIKHAKRTEDDTLIAVYVNADVPVIELETPIGEQNIIQELYSKGIGKYKDYAQEKGLNSKGNIGYFDLIHKTYNIFRDQIAKMTIEKYPPDILINISKDSAGFFEFDKVKILVEIGRKATARSIKP